MKPQNQHPAEYCPPIKYVNLDEYDGPDNMADIADDKEPMETWEDEE